MSCTFFKTIKEKVTSDDAIQEQQKQITGCNTVLDDWFNIVTNNPGVRPIYRAMYYILRSFLNDRMHTDTASFVPGDHVWVPDNNTQKDVLFLLHENTKQYTATHIHAGVYRILHESIVAGDPYVFPVSGSPRKLPNMFGVYRLYQNNLTGVLVNVTVDRQQIACRTTTSAYHTVDRGYFLTELCVHTRSVQYTLDLCALSTLQRTELPWVETNARAHRDMSIALLDSTYVYRTLAVAADVYVEVRLYANVQIGSGVRLHVGACTANQNGLVYRATNIQRHHTTIVASRCVRLERTLVAAQDDVGEPTRRTHVGRTTASVSPCYQRPMQQTHIDSEAM